MHVEGLGALVYRFAQGFAWLEVGYALFRDRHGFAAAWIAAHARRAVIDGKTAKAPNLDPMAFDQGLADGVKDGLDGEFSVLVRELAKAGGQFFDEVRAGHGVLGHRVIQ